MDVYEDIEAAFGRANQLADELRNLRGEYPSRVEQVVIDQIEAITASLADALDELETEERDHRRESIRVSRDFVQAEVEALR